MLHRRWFRLTLLLAVGLALWTACAPARTTSLPAGLQVEEHALLGAPTLDPLDFKPVEASMASILERHAAQRSQTFPDNSLLVDGLFSMRATLDGDVLIATQDYDTSGAAGRVTLTRDGTEIYRIEIGQASPITALRGLWVYDGHWILETTYITAEQVVGKLIRDGELLNDRYGYADAFDFQLLHGRPFFFFRKEGRLGFSYDGQDVMAGYDEIPRYGCCSAAEVNARHAQDMIAFFARRDQTWYYVELGVFD